MPRHDLLTVAMRRTYGGIFSLLLDCTDVEELKWFRGLLQARPWIKFPGQVGPPEQFWDHRYRLQAVLDLVGGQDWEKQQKSLEVLWMALDQAGERGWQAFGAEVRSHHLSIAEQADRDVTYGLPFVYHLRREAAAGSLRLPQRAP